MVLASAMELDALDEAEAEQEANMAELKQDEEVEGMEHVDRLDEAAAHPVPRVPRC